MFFMKVTKQLSFFPLCLRVSEYLPALSVFWKIPDRRSAKLKKDPFKIHDVVERKSEQMLPLRRRRSAGPLGGGGVGGVAV